MKLEQIYFNSPEFDTLGKWANFEFSPIFSDYYRQNLLNFLDLGEPNNWQRILQSYQKSENSESLISRNTRIFNSGDFENIEIIPGTVFVINPENSKTDYFTVQGSSVQSVENINLFLSRAMKNLYANPAYALRARDFTKGNIKSIHPKITVWLWARSSGETSYFYNLSPFIQSLSISAQKEVSICNFSLTPINGEYKDGKPVLKQSAVQEFIKNKQVNYTSQNQINKKLGDYLKYENFFFHDLIKQNDLVYVMFGQSPSDFDQEKTYFQVPTSKVNEKVWDFIGLVDTNSISIAPSQNDVSISVQARDLSKTLIEDGCYFWASEFRLDGTYVFMGNREESNIAKRVGNTMNTLFAFSAKSIEYCLRFVLNQLSSTGFVPGGIFNSYPDKTTLYRYGKDADEPTLTEEEASGVWKIIKFIIDPQITNLRVIDQSIVNEQGSLMNYMKKICQDPFVEFYGETIGDRYYFIARRPPHNKRAILDVLDGYSINEPLSANIKPKASENVQDGIYDLTDIPITLKEQLDYVIDIEPEDVENFNVQFDTTVYTWYQLTAQALSQGLGEAAALSYLPAIFFPKMVEAFGSRPYQQVTNYLVFNPTIGSNLEANADRFYKQYFYDLQWIIQTTLHLPFTRRGTITINLDRRIKKNTFVRFKPTGEIFYVDSLTHSNQSSSSLSYQTTLNVSRGMVEEFISGVPIEGVSSFDNNYVSYFHLAELPIEERDFRTSDSENPVKQKVISKWREDAGMIDFFLKGKQFDYGHRSFRV